MLTGFCDLKMLLIYEAVCEENNSNYYEQIFINFVSGDWLDFSEPVVPLECDTAITV